MHGLKALFFDVFGTLVDWRTGVAGEAGRLFAPRGISRDWLAFADAWRGEYERGMAPIRSGASPFVPLDVIHRRMLEDILPRFELDRLDEETRVEVNFVWHRLDAWPEVPGALARLREKFVLAPVSNGNIAIQVDLARRNNFVWDAILGGDVARDYKPKPAVYLGAVAALNLQPGACMMVASHSYDLEAAASHGLRTAHIARPDEHGPGKGETMPSVPVDLALADLGALADALGA